MYITPRGRKNVAYSEKYMQIDNTLDDITHSLPVGFSDASTQVKQAKNMLNMASSEAFIYSNSKYFYELGRNLDELYEILKSQKAKTQEQNVKNIKST